MQVKVMRTFLTIGEGAGVEVYELPYSPETQNVAYRWRDSERVGEWQVGTLEDARFMAQVMKQRKEGNP